MSLLLISLLAGCPTGTDPVACTEIAVSSVMVNVSTEDGGEATPTVTYDDGSGPVACDGDGATFVCGYEVAGDLVIRVEAEGYDAFEQTVTVGSDECHVITETLDVVLAPASVDCTMEERASVLATVAGSSGEALTGVQVAYVLGDTTASIACSPSSGDEWACGWEEAGSFAVTASADGHVPETVTVEVTEDECHVITETIAFELDWGAD